MTNKNADYDELFACTVAGTTTHQHEWVTVPDIDLDRLRKCLRCQLVQLPPSVTGADLWPHGPYEIPNARAKQVLGQVIYEPHIMRTVGDAYDGLPDSTGQPGQLPPQPPPFRLHAHSRRHGPQ